MLSLNKIWGSRFVGYLLYSIVFAFAIVALVWNPEPEKIDLLNSNGLALIVGNDVKIDWHDYAAIARDANRTGIGEHGAASVLNIKSPLRKILHPKYGFDAMLSSFISINRSLPDTRHPECKNKKYYKKLPQVSVVLPFYNEYWSTILRAVYSLINRTPAELLKEIILVDDCSTKDHLKKQLDDFIDQNFKKVKVLRLKRRYGLMQSRVAGGKMATGEVLVFLDAHIEVNVNWLPPLLEPIVENPRTCVCPILDFIDSVSFAYWPQPPKRGTFDWDAFYYKKLDLLPYALEHPTEPYYDPVMSGGAFVIRADFFWELGGYDEELDVWGGEQFELSFKIWQCGGRMVDAPCSRIGHVYRIGATDMYTFPSDVVGRNFKRIAEVWMDDYAKHIYKYSPERYDRIDVGDLSKMKNLRKDLKCKSFQWYLDNVAFDLINAYPADLPPDFAFGTIKSLAKPSLCIDSIQPNWYNFFSLNLCALNSTNPELWYQAFILGYRQDIESKALIRCFAADKVNMKLLVVQCTRKQGAQRFKYDYKSKQIIHDDNYCADADIDKKIVTLSLCDKNSLTQKWQIGYVNETLLDHWSDYNEGYGKALEIQKKSGFKSF